MRERNEKALRDYREAFYESYQKVKEKPVTRCLVEEAYNNEKIISCLKENRRWRLNSRYIPEHAAQLYAKRYEKLPDYAPIFFFGMSDGRVIRNVLADMNGTQTLIIYEPETEIFLTSIAHFEWEDIFQNEKVYLIVNGINEMELSQIMREMICFENRDLVTNCILPNYDMIFSEECKEYIENLLYFIRMTVFMANTEVVYGRKTGENILWNFPYILKGGSVNELCEYFKKEDVGRIPAVIVSAGPSLDKNIRELKNIQNRAFIIGVDSALKALLREGIHVDLAVSVDFNKNPDVFSDERVHDIPFLLSVAALPLLAKKSRQRLFFRNTGGFEGFQRILEEQTGKKIEGLESGGSVATDAFSLAVAMGFQNIILIGQDLAFTEGKGHVSGFEKSEKEDKEHVKSRITVEVEGMNGESLMTDIQMNSYRQWFELHIAALKDFVTVYNATEGGARIHGAVELTLKEALEELCEEEIDMGKLISEVPYMLDESEQLCMRSELLKAGERLEQLCRKIKRGIRAYEELIELDRKGKQHTSGYKRAVEVITETNQITETEPYMQFVCMYAKTEEYSLAGDIYTSKELSVREIAERGIALLKGYVNAIPYCKEQMEQILFDVLKESVSGKD